MGTIHLKYIADHLPAKGSFELFYGIGKGIKYEYIHTFDQTLRIVDDQGNQAYFYGNLNNDKIRAIITKANPYS